MAYDEGLAEKIRILFADHSGIEEKKMFGGLCFMLSNHMCCGVVGDLLMARVGPVNYEKLLAREHAKEMTFTGNAMKGMIYVDPLGISEDSDLKEWLAWCVGFVETLPPKTPEKKK